MGPNINAKMERYGFHPAGGGRFTVEIAPCSSISSLCLEERGEINHRRGIAIVPNLARNIAQREIDMLGHLLGWGGDCFEIFETKNSAGPGNVVMVEIGTDKVTEVFTGFGCIGASAEHVASEAGGAARSYLISEAFAGEHLADQLLLPMAIAGKGSLMTTKVSAHAKTNMEVIAHFLPVVFSVDKKEKGTRICVETNP